ncbi:phosphotransferase [Thalassorhabdus alkalitolerans]|uniref:Phosphotransferase n=1 Tax=Thalassorhabdus alkalitolerans TaxID=2282697 RepID=A0ABW0YM59_9BACI
MKNTDYYMKTRVKLLKPLLGEGWDLEPAGGATGEAYIAHDGERKLFLKRNSSPFLAVLSAEGIVPKLLWTKRLENGDVITAQQWVYGRELSAHEMTRVDVAKLLSKIHSSSELLDMFKRIGNEPLTPASIVEDLQNQILHGGLSHPMLQEAVTYLSSMREKVAPPEMVVCHCDINHNNWIISEKEHLYLIDWDGATVADPALDLGLLLYEYLPKSQWGVWLKSYGVILDDQLEVRMHWYVISHALSALLFHLQQGETEEIERWNKELRKLLTSNRLFPEK